MPCGYGLQKPNPLQYDVAREWQGEVGQSVVARWCAEHAVSDDDIADTL